MYKRQFVVAAAVNLELVRGGSTAALITYSQLNDGAHEWEVPTNALGKYSIRMMDAAGTGIFCDSPEFTIGEKEAWESVAEKLWWIPLVAAVVGMALSARAYSLDKAENDGKARVSEAQYGMICTSLCDVISDMLFTADCAWAPAYFYPALVFLLL